MTLQANLDTHKGRQEKEVKELKVTNEKVLKEKSDLEEMIFQMQTKVIFMYQHVTLRFRFLLGQGKCCYVVKFHTVAVQPRKTNNM